MIKTVSLCFAACDKTVCSDVGDLHLQWHRSQVSVIDIVEDLLHFLIDLKHREDVCYIFFSRN